MALRKNDRSFWALIVLISAVLITWFVLPARLIDPIWYSIKYWVHAGQVEWTPKPTDCDYTPTKCHYTKSVIAYNAKGEPVAGDGVPQCKHDIRHGTIVISYDDKTWTPLPTGSACPDRNVSNVEIKWVKVKN